MGVGNSSGRLRALVVVLLVAASICVVVVAQAGGAKLVGKDGRVYACYKAKGKAKGAVRLVPKKGHCRKGEKKISWGVAGPAGENGQGGENGSNGTAGEGGSGGEKGGAGTQSLQKQVESLTSKLSSVEAILKGITNGDLTGILSKLQGISPTQLQEAVTSVGKVNELCSQTKALTSQSNALGSAIGGLQLLGNLPPLELKQSPTAPVPTPLSTFSCP